MSYILNNEIQSSGVSAILSTTCVGDNTTSLVFKKPDYLNQ